MQRSGYIHSMCLLQNSPIYMPINQSTYVEIAGAILLPLSFAIFQDLGAWVAVWLDNQNAYEM